MNIDVAIEFLRLHNKQISAYGLSAVGSSIFCKFHDKVWTVNVGEAGLYEIINILNAFKITYDIKKLNDKYFLCFDSDSDEAEFILRSYKILDAVNANSTSLALKP